MIVSNNIQELRENLKSKFEGACGFVPTMGALHTGHIKLVERARHECQNVIVSIFVNPTQFNNIEDLAKYPITLENDIELLTAAGVDILFMPNYQELYPDNYNYKIIESELSPKLCGASRPGHFEGMLTVVMKLLQIVAADKAYFGEKDFQQLQLVKGLVAAFFVPTQIIACPTVRDEHGLALSSRNRRLSADGLKTAREFAKILSDNSLTLQTIRQQLESLNLQIDYLEETKERRFAAVLVENVRLIDNVAL